jgi:hypothetical protein
MTTRCHPRTSRDAFKGLDYSCAVEKPADNKRYAAVNIALAIGLLVVVWAVIFQGVPK